MPRKRNELDHATLVRYLMKYREEHGYSPSRREIAAQFGIGLDSAQRSVEDLVAEGLLDVTPNIPRAMNITGAGMKLAQDSLTEFS